MRSAPPAERGFTLIELLVVVGIVAILALAAGPAVESITGANARQAAGALAGTMRALYDTAALRNVTCRLALDVDGRAWWAECARSRAGMARDPDKQPPSAEELAERFPEEKDADRRRLLARTEFGAYSDRLVAKRELPGRARFDPLRVEGRREAVDKGVAYVYFFPGGQTQRAYVPVADGSNLYTVVLEPLTGHARVAYGKVEVKE
ncbi:MAG TPA: type II secretion system protein [Anaeromyxobacteraceae bacterium]|nr:type II secretion system protein [Anaeromyxobacteraceae bacterium]